MITQTHHQDTDIVMAFLNIARQALGDRLPIEDQRRIEADIRILWGGQEVYVKKTNVLCNVDSRARALDIRSRYNMCNRRELQAEYGLGRSQFYKILKGG